jgi:PAS domain S-box-containing protein
MDKASASVLHPNVISQLARLTAALTVDPRRNINTICRFADDMIISGRCVYVCSDKLTDTLQIFGSHENTIAQEAGNMAFFAALLQQAQANRDRISAREWKSVAPEAALWPADYSSSVYLIPIAGKAKLPSVLCFFLEENSPISPRDREVFGYFGALVQHQEELLAAQKAPENEIDYNTLFSRGPSGLLYVDRQHRILEANNSCCTMFGYQVDELRMKSLNDLIMSHEDSDKDELQWTCPKQGTTSENFVPRKVSRVMKRKNGSSFSAELDVVPGQEGASGCFVIVRDISSRLLAENELMDAKKKAEEADRLKSAFLANMSHEIRTPLNSIIGFSELIIDEETNPKEKAYFLTLISSAGRTLLQLIDDIIDISKIEAGQLKITPSRTEVNAIMDELKVNYENEKIKRNKTHIDLRVHKAYEGEFFILADPFRFRQIMMNLLTNALKFVDEGFIEFGYTDMHQEQVQFFVKDTGIGIEKDKSNVIFTRFGQVDTAYKRNLDGTGLGLAITHHLVGLMGGAIWFDSEPGKGSTFYYTLPASLSLQPKTFVSVHYGRIMYDWSDKVFLIVDDVEANFLFLKAVFRETGALLLWGRNGTEAVKICRNNPNISLVLMDIIMPEMDGYEAVKIIKTFAPRLPVIAQTAFAGENEEENALRAGCEAWISKPVSKIELASMIKKLLEST